MTLSTHIKVGSPMPLDELWDHCRRLIGTPDDIQFKDEESTHGAVGARARLNPPGIGLPGWLWINYNADGPHDTKETWDAEQKQYAEDYDGEEIRPYPWPWPVMFDIDLDTGYSYHGPNNSTCSDFHAWFIVKVGEFLDDRGIPWGWVDEFSGDTHVGTEGLKEFGTAEIGEPASFGGIRTLKNAIDKGLEFIL